MEQWEREDGVGFLASIGIRSGHTVLDFGCRIGHYSIPAAFAVGPSGTVYAVDKDQQPLEELSAKAAKYGLSNIRMLRTSGRDPLDIQDNTLDVLLMYDVLHYFDYAHRNKLYKDARRTLKPVGLLSVYPKHTAENMPLKELANVRLQDIKHEITASGFHSAGCWDAVISHDDNLELGHVMNFRSTKEYGNLGLQWKSETGKR